jgi:type I restriction enzyme M protein
MLTRTLRTLIDDKWNAFWPVSEVKPLVIPDYVAYFLFIKKLDEQQLIESGKNSSGNTFLYSKENDELRWTQFKDMDPKNLYKLFTKAKGVLHFMNDYGQANHLYSIYLKEPLLITPTPKLLMNTVDFIKFMEAEDSMSHAAIYEYLLNKQEIAGQNGQVFAPDNIVLSKIFGA